MMEQEIRIVGLTGGIGTGKSTAAEYLKGKGFAHIDADAISRDITADGSPMLSVLDGLFGPSGQFGKEGVEILRPDGSLDRAALASLVFTDQGRKRQLDQVMFRAIIAEIDQQIDAWQKAGTAGAAVDLDEAVDSDRAVAHQKPVGILLDAPLLFEAGLDARCDLVLLLVADEEVRVRRVCSRDGVTKREVRDRINSQLSDDEKREKSDVIIDNSGSREDLAQRLEKFYTKFSKNSCKRFSMVL